MDDGDEISISSSFPQYTPNHSQQAAHNQKTFRNAPSGWYVKAKLILKHNYDTIYIFTTTIYYVHLDNNHYCDFVLL